jgi:DnaJ-domain-containing protein 1
VDQIFDRLERLIKSWLTMDDGDRVSGGSRSSGDPDLDAAMSELDDFLGSSRTETEEREHAQAAERERKARLERERASRTGAGSGTYGQGGQAYSAQAEARRALEESYKTLSLPYGSPFVEVKAAYKKLLKIHHPDLNAQTPESLKRATAISSRINVAYQLIEAWEQSGRRTMG